MLIAAHRAIARVRSRIFVTDLAEWRYVDLASCDHFAVASLCDWHLDTAEILNPEQLAGFHRRDGAAVGERWTRW